MLLIFNAPKENTHTHFGHTATKSKKKATKKSILSDFYCHQRVCVLPLRKLIFNIKFELLIENWARRHH